MDDVAVSRRLAARSIVVALVATAAAIAGATVVALESGGVAVVRGHDAEGRPYSTRVWFAEDGGDLWLEAATADRDFFEEAERAGTLLVEVDGAAASYRAVVVPEPGGHRRIRELLAAKYGWRDAWIALLQDTSASRAVRLATEAPARPKRDAKRR